MRLSLESLVMRQVAIWGFGREGQAALRFLRRTYPEKKIGLILSPEEAAGWDLSGDPLLEVVTEVPSAGTFGAYQIVIKSPGISPLKHRNAMHWAHFRGTRFVSGTQLWFSSHASDKTIAITGTKGKSTTSALTAALLRDAGARTVLAGNIGLPLLDVMDPQPTPEYWVIEMSSFQAADFEGHPAIAAVLNLSPEHLDWHGDEDSYYRDKLRLCQKAELAVVNAADERLMALSAGVAQRALFNHRGFWHARGSEVWHDEERVLDLRESALSGAHNASNVAAACTIVEAFGLNPRGHLRAVREFRPLPHRLTRLGEREGIVYIDDSIATTPQAALAALAALANEDRQRTVLLLGGFDRGLPWEDFAASVIADPPRALVTMGQAGPRIADTLRSAPGAAAALHLHESDTLDAALARARSLLPGGGIVLLSPGAPSFDQFKDYAERGREFARLAGFDQALDETILGMGQG